jgi:hypothetical protein
MAISSRQEITARLLRTASVGVAHPRLSIVVVGEVSRHWLEALVNMLPWNGLPLAVEVLVVRAGGRRAADERELRHSIIRYVAAPANATCAEMRANGIRHASGDFVVFLDDGRPVDPGLIERLTGEAAPGAASGISAPTGRETGT